MAIDIKIEINYLKVNLNKIECRDNRSRIEVKTKYNQHPTFWNGYFIIEKV